jgi:hypothetical protein
MLLHRYTLHRIFEVYTSDQGPKVTAPKQSDIIVVFTNLGGV